MSNETIHQPMPEFRDYLEDEITRVFRRDRRMRHLRIVALVLVSVALGSSGGMAAAQMRDGARRDSLLTAAMADAAMVAVRLDLARAVATDVASKVKAGVLAPASLVSAETDLRTAEAEAMRVRLNIDEIRASGQPPRNELNAPLVDARDFVLERIRLDLFAAQHRLTLAERALEEAARRARAGGDDDLPRIQAEVAVARATAALGALAERQTLRREFVAKGTPGDQLVRRMRLAELRHEAHAAQQAVRLATELLARLDERHRAGGVDEIAVLRARLELREHELELQQLARQLQQVGRDGAGGGN